MRVLVTGGAGFIGSHLCEKLLARGDEVVCVDNLNDYYSPARKRKNIESFAQESGFSFYKVDITDAEALDNVFKKERLDKVVHLAARAGVRPSIEQPILYERVNVGGTLNVLECARIYGVRHFIFGSTSSVYGNNKKVPFSEEDNVDHPISPYAATKKAGELLCSTYSHLYGMNITCLRFFTVYGPKGRPDMAPYLFTDWIYRGKEIKRFGDGATQRDYTYVDDVVVGILAALGKEFPYEIINLGNAHTVGLNEFICVVEDILGRKAKIREMPAQPGDMPRTYADIRKAQRLLGYKPSTSITVGMQQFVSWYEEQKNE